MLQIIVPLDMSPTAERSLPLARAVAAQLSASVVLVSVIEVSSDLEDFVSTRDFKADVVRLERDLSEYLDEIATTFSGVPVETVIRMGTPVRIVADLTESFDNALLVIASHGRTGIRRHLVGSVAMQLIHEVACPVFVVTAGSSAEDTVAPIDRALVPLDGSALSEAAVESISRIFGGHNVSLHIVRVVELGAWRSMPFASLGDRRDDTIQQVAHETVAAYLDDMRGRLEQQGLRVTSEARTGNVPEQIRIASTTHDCDIIAMGTHGRTGFKRLLMGSNAEHVIRDSPVPVLLQRPAS